MSQCIVLIAGMCLVLQEDLRHFTVTYLNIYRSYLLNTRSQTPANHGGAEPLAPRSRIWQPKATCLLD